MSYLCYSYTPNDRIWQWQHHWHLLAPTVTAAVCVQVEVAYSCLQPYIHSYFGDIFINHSYLAGQMKATMKGVKNMPEEVKALMRAVKRHTKG